MFGIVDRRRFQADLKSFDDDRLLGPCTVRSRLMDAIADHDAAAALFRKYAGPDADPETAEVWQKFIRPPKVDASEIEAPAPGSREVIQWVSTRDADRDGDIVLPKGMITSEFERSGSPVLWGHNYSLPPIGRDLWIRPYPAKSPYGLLAKTVYDTDPFADQVFGKKQRGFLNTNSVGFLPIAWVRAGEQGWEPLIQSLARTYGEEFMDDSLRAKNIITKAVLLEHSDVSIPANVNALVTAVAKGEVEVSPEERKRFGLPPVRMRVPHRRVVPQRVIVGATL